MSTIITIGRQFGSGGRYIGKLVADKLKIKYIDKELITEVAKKGGYAEKVVSELEEKPTTPFTYTLMGMGMHGAAYYDVPIQYKVFSMQSEKIKKEAEEDCVIVGRCSDFILKDNPDAVHVFIYGNYEDRVNTIMKRNDCTKEAAESSIKKIDKARARYYNFYTDTKWGDRDNYDLLINTSRISHEKAADLILDYLKLKKG